MRKFKLDPAAFDKFIFQNKADLIETFEGCLLDNYLYQGKRGMFAIYEKYVNPNMSEYLVVFAKNENEIDRLWSEFMSNAA